MCKPFNRKNEIACDTEQTTMRNSMLISFFSQPSYTYDVWVLMNGGTGVLIAPRPE